MIAKCNCGNIILLLFQDNVMSVCLCDTSTEIDIHINDTLINEDHAEISFAEGLQNSGLGGIQQQVELIMILYRTSK